LPGGLPFLLGAPRGQGNIIFFCGTKFFFEKNDMAGIYPTWREFLPKRKSAKLAPIGRPPPVLVHSLDGGLAFSPGGSGKKSSAPHGKMPVWFRKKCRSGETHDERVHCGFEYCHTEVKVEKPVMAALKRKVADRRGKIG
jgi:hypothetical protein